jgi:hypothetical protein
MLGIGSGPPREDVWCGSESKTIAGQKQYCEGDEVPEDMLLAGESLPADEALLPEDPELDEPFEPEM